MPGRPEDSDHIIIVIIVMSSSNSSSKRFQSKTLSSMWRKMWYLVKVLKPGSVKEARGTDDYIADSPT